MQERRATPRAPIQLPVRLKGKGVIRWAEALTKDLSPGGLRCTMYGAFWPVGTDVQFEMPLFPADDPLSGIAKVVHMGEVPYSDRFYVGLQFSLLSETASQQLKSYFKQRGTTSAPPGPA